MIDLWNREDKKKLGWILISPLNLSMMHVFNSIQTIFNPIYKGSKKRKGSRLYKYTFCE